MAEYETFAKWLKRLLHPERDSASAFTVEAFGWLLLAEGIAIFIAPHGVAAFLHLPDFSAATAVYFRLIGLLIAGLGALYTVSGRVNAQGFVFASFFDRPIVPVIMAVLWWNGLIPAILAIAFSVQDFGSFLWTARAWHTERKNMHGKAK
ncbi:hypothetical protein SAMN05519104_8346 [Rhizobiales bacterium GAS188]|nr:hypothetical protein SAMN05519104_8346 [Rhizobiales bacterium GAS188]